MSRGRGARPDRLDQLGDACDERRRRGRAAHEAVVAAELRRQDVCARRGDRDARIPPSGSATYSPGETSTTSPSRDVSSFRAA